MIDADLISVLSLDPGGTTGYAWGNIEDGLMTVSTGQAQWSVNDLWFQLNETHPDIIIIERFDYRNRARKGLQLISVELIGVVHLYCATVESDPKRAVELFEQQPGSVINQYFNKKKLEHDGLWHQNQTHGNEACMHLLHWFTFGAGYKYNKRGYQAYTNLIKEKM